MPYGGTNEQIKGVGELGVFTVCHPKTPDPVDYSDHMARCGQSSRDHGHETVFLSIACKEVGEEDEFQASGWELLEAFLGPVQLVTWMKRPSAGKPAQSDDP